jgi:hypothetical protein
MQDLLSLHDALEDFDSCEYSLHTTVQMRIGAQTRPWQLLLSPPMFPGTGREHAVLVQLSRGISDDDVQEQDIHVADAHDMSDTVAMPGAGAVGTEVIRLQSVCEPDLLRIAQTYGIDPEAHIWELAWAVPPHAMTIPRGQDPRWPNAKTAER